MKNRFRIFLVSMFSTFLFLILFIGLMVVDKNTKSIAFGDNSPILSIEKEKGKLKKIDVNFFGKHLEINKIFW